MKFQLPSFISFIVTTVGMIGRVGLVNFIVIFYLSLVLSSHPPDEPLWICVRNFKWTSAKNSKWIFNTFGWARRAPTKQPKAAALHRRLKTAARRAVIFLLPLKVDKSTFC